MGGPGAQKSATKVRLQMLPNVQLPHPEPSAPAQPELETRVQPDPMQTLPTTEPRAVFPQTGPQPYFILQPGSPHPTIPQHGLQQGFLIQQPGGQPLFTVIYPSMAGVQPQFHPEHFPQYPPYRAMLYPAVFPQLPGHLMPVSPDSQPGQQGNPGSPQQQQDQQQRPQVPLYFDSQLLVGTSGGLSSEELEQARMAASGVQRPATNPAAQPLNPIMHVNPVMHVNPLMPLGPLLPIGPMPGLPPVMVSDPALVPVEVPAGGAIPSHDATPASLDQPQAPAVTPTAEWMLVTDHQTDDANVDLVIRPAEVLTSDPVTGASCNEYTMETDMGALSP
ncbi:ameloblastin [Alosa sapidissima]|uniref:ameloblastin n=1 Tax=Alosa sapidissima TaxID=34773 RepID=UPI001C0801E1|nr:ameloblastin [Alosa sapidissima]